MVLLNKITKLIFIGVVFVLSINTLHAQAITYGDTIFFENFGQHTTRVQTIYMPAGSYTFADANGSENAKEINDNYYAIIDPRHIADARPSSYFWTSTSPWVATPAGALVYYTADHTGNTNGAVMVVNAGTTINYLYKRPVVLKTGFRYRFAFWIYLVRKSSQFSMEIINSTINTTKTFTGPILDNEGVWIQYTLDFPVPLSATDTTNNVTAGLQNLYSLIMGNDYYIDDILLSTLHTDPLSVIASDNSPVCQGSPINFIVTPTGGASPFTYSWTGPNGFTSTNQNPVIDNSTSKMDGTYTVIVTDALGQTRTSSVKIVVNPTPNSDFILSSYSINSRNNSVDYSVLPTNGVNYQWDFGDGTYDNQVSSTHTYTITGSSYEFVVKLIATDTLGCTTTTLKTIEVTPFVPNVFSPNGDGVNDVFMQGFDLHVFDRYGTELYKGTSGWDGTYKGKKMDNDTYFYSLNYIDKFHKVHALKGYITLKR
ncbi:MAG: T9SS type B sorting domain-containing protein [Paludibacter sp.]|nr:T9SS type B sorting domain-containing protein [Paludibacter sp.]